MDLFSMSRESQRKEAIRWFEQAKDDLSSAKILSGNKKFAQSCFYCQQAAEKALKSLWFMFGFDPWGHSILRLMQDYEDELIRMELNTFIDHARILDRYYIPTRYPNGLPDLIPFEAYGFRDAQEAIVLTNEVIETITNLLKI